MCTRIFWSGNSIARVASRTMDWAVNDEPRLWALPAGLHRTGGLDEAVEWDSRYGSLALSMFEARTTDGINDQGLAAHSLYLTGAEFADPADRPVVGNTLWAQWVLDNFATVADAVKGMIDLHVTSVPVRGQDLQCHLAIEDASGDSAIIEPLGGELVVHHGEEFTVMANDPTFDVQLENVKQSQTFGGDLPLPGDISSVDRFVRATYFLKYLPEPASIEETVAGVIHLASNVAVPPGAPYDDFSIYPTWWITAVDLTNPTYYFWSRQSSSLIWADLETVALSVGAPVRVLDPETTGLIGDGTELLVPAEEPIPY